MSIDREVRERMVDLAGEVLVPAAPEQVIRRRVRAVRRRRAAVAGSALLTVAVVAASMILTGINPRGGELAAMAGDGPFLAWDRAGEPSDTLADDAVRTWDSTGQAHREVRVLLTTTDSVLGSVVVLQAYNGAGEPRVGFFAAPEAPASAMRLLADRPAPDPASTRVVSLVSPRRPAGFPGDAYWSGYAIAVAMPGVTRLRITSTTIDDEMVEGNGPPTGRYLVRTLPRSSTALTVRVKGFAGTRTAFDSPAQAGATGDAQYLPATVLQRTEDHLEVSVTDVDRVRVGQLVAVAGGLVGRIAQVDTASRRAQVQLPTAPGFDAPAYTDISNQHGALRHHPGGGLMFDDLATTAQVNAGNRILVPDPAQGDPLAGAITAARPTSTRTGGQTAVPADPAVTIGGLREVFISVPAAAR